MSNFGIQNATLVSRKVNNLRHFCVNCGKLLEAPFDGVRYDFNRQRFETICFRCWDNSHKKEVCH